MTSLGVAKTIGDICSLGGIDPDVGWAIASGQGAAAFGIDGNKIEEGAEADIVIMDASLGSREDNVSDALAEGEFPGVAVVITDGVVRVNGSLCTLRARRIAEISKFH